MENVTKREELVQLGIVRATMWCELNKIDMPPVYIVEATRVNACAYYRPTQIVISPKQCARPGYGGRAWSWPAYVIDRTPYGVVPHEVGHHVDWWRSGAKGPWDICIFSSLMHQEADEPPLTGYAPNIGEWWAEMFRLFVTNPNLLFHVRPRTYTAIMRSGLLPLDNIPWRHVLATAPRRTLDMAAKKVAAAALTRAPRPLVLPLAGGKAHKAQSPAAKKGK